MDADTGADLAAYLIAECWLLATSFEPERGVYFSRFAAPRLRNKTIDWIRKHRKRTRWVFGDGRVYERKLPEFVCLDDSLAEALPALTGDPAADRDEGLGWLLDERDSHAARDYRLLGLETPR